MKDIECNFKFTQVDLPGRIDMRLIDPAASGCLCSGCERPVGYPMDPNCDCDEWKEFLIRRDQGGTQNEQ